MSEKLRIVAVAVCFGDATLSMPPPSRHDDLLRLTEGFQAKRSPFDMGFLLSDGTFASRSRAYKIAHTSGQMLPRQAGQYNGPDLFSEDLW